MTKPTPDSASSEATFAIVGAGIAGTLQAIHLAAEYPRLKILLFDKKPQILSGTSGMNPGRPAFGFHYKHLETAKFCLDKTVQFTKFLDCLGCPTIFSQAPQRGLYVLMREAVPILNEMVEPVFDSDEIKIVFEQIKEYAKKRYSHDEDFKRLFGAPDQICRELERHEYQHFLTPAALAAVGACYETAEMTLDITGICAFLRNYIEGIANILILTGSNVTSVERVGQLQRTGYCITWDDGSSASSYSITVDFLTLACWENVGFFRKQLDMPSHQPTYNRLKMLAIVDIDAVTTGIDTIRPIFVASGPFCMVSPQERITKPDGSICFRCACTLAIRTNLMTVPDSVPLPEIYDGLLRSKVKPSQLGMAEDILEGAKQLLSCLRDAELVDVRFGTVRVPFGNGDMIDLHDPSSEHHKRDHPGCYRLARGLFVNESMKVVYGVHNAERILAWLSDELI